MDQLDLIIEQSNQTATEEIEHWCPVCDRLILPTHKLVGPAESDRPATPALDNEIAKAPTNTTSPVAEAPAPTTPTSAQRSATSSPISRRKAGQGHGALRGGGKFMPHRSRISVLNATTGLQNKRKPDHLNRSNPNFVNDFVLSTHGAGAAPRAKTSPIGNTTHLDNAKLDEDLQGEAELLRTKDLSSDRPADPQGREDAPPMVLMKRKSSVPDVNAGPRLKPLTKSKVSSKPRPKSLNLITAQIVEVKDVVTPKTSKTSGLTPTTALGPETPTSAVTRPQYAVEDLRRRLYCSEACYTIDLKGEKFDVYRPLSPTFHDSPVTGTPPNSPPGDSPKRPYEIKRNMSCEMPWLWTNAISKSSLPRRMAPTRNPSWLADEEEFTSYDHVPSVSERMLSWPPFPQTKTGPIGVAPRKPIMERKQSKPLEPQEVDALRKMAPAFRGQSNLVHIDSPVDGNSSSEFCRTDSARSLPTGAPMRKARPLFEDEKNEHKLFFRRMPGKLHAAPMNIPPLFVVDGQWTETPPPGFDYAGFMENREKERRKRQMEITEAMLLKKNVDSVGVADEVTRRHHEAGRRKKRVDADKSQYERRVRTMHGTGYFDDPEPGKQRQQWWRLDEREDWKTYWAARDDGLEDVTFEQWQLERHAERVQHAEREQALKRVEGDRRRVQAEVVGARVAGDGKKVAKRPLLIRVASQPTVSDVDLVGQFYKEGETMRKQHKERTASFLATRTSSSSSEASPLGMNRSKALPVLNRSVDSNVQPERAATPSSFMRGNTLCISGFVVEAEAIEKTKSPTNAGFVFPLVPVPGSVESATADTPVPIQVVAAAARSPLKSPSIRVPPGLALPASALISPLPKSPLGNTPGLAHPDSPRARPQLKKSNTLFIDPPTSQLTAPNDTPATHLSPRRRIQSLQSLTLTLPELKKIEEPRRSSLIIPRSPLGLHSFSAAELPKSEICGRISASAKPPSRTGAESSISRSSTLRSKQADMPMGSRRRTLPPLVINKTVSASMSPAYACSSEHSLGLAQEGIPADVLMGSPEVVTAVSGIGSGSGSSGGESTWSRADVRPNRNTTIKVNSARTLPRVPRNLAFTQVRPKSMGPMEHSTSTNNAPVPTTNAQTPKANDSEVDDPLFYSVSLLRFYADFRGGSSVHGGGAKSRPPPITTTNTSSTEQGPQVGKRRSLWGLFGSAKP